MNKERQVFVRLISKPATNSLFGHGCAGPNAPAVGSIRPLLSSCIVAFYASGAECLTRIAA
ncbi:protein of unknown function [Hyphomicrobium sp. MC1]|nr:protein of unknown function [Hyphomicrobium sp. MC1]